MAIVDRNSNTLIGTGFFMEEYGPKQQIWVPDSDLKRHAFIAGTTGVGKTRLCENWIEQDILKGHSVIYFDPKGDQDIFVKIYELARKTGRLDDLMVVTPIFPEYSAVVDPLHHYHMVDELVGNIVAGIKEGKDPFFRNIAKEITTAVITANMIILKAQGFPPRINIDQVRQSIRIASLKELASALRAIGTTEAEDIAGGLQDIIDSGPDYYNKVASSLRTCLSDLCFGNIGQIIGKAESNIFMERLETGKKVILVVHTGSMITREAGLTLGKVILATIQSFIGRVYLSNRKTLNHTLSIHIDEMQSLAFPEIEDMFAKVGSANVSIKAYVQSIDQLIEAVGEPKAYAILANANTKVFMRSSDVATAEYVAKHFGVHTKMQGIYGSGTVTTREMEEDVLKITDITSLRPQEFYMTSYMGRYRGKTEIAWDPKTKMNFPSTSMVFAPHVAEPTEDTADESPTFVPPPRRERPTEEEDY